MWLDPHLGPGLPSAWTSKVKHLDSRLWIWITGQERFAIFGGLFQRFDAQIDDVTSDHDLTFQVDDIISGGSQHIVILESGSQC